MEHKKSVSNILCLIFVIYPYLPLIKEQAHLVGNLIEVTLIVALLISESIKIGKFHATIKISKKIMAVVIILSLYTCMAYQDFYDAASAFRIYLLYIGMIGALADRRNSVDIRAIVNICVVNCIVMAIGSIIQFPFPELIESLHTNDSLLALKYKTNFVPFSSFNRSISLMLDPNILGAYFTFNAYLLDCAFWGCERKGRIYYIVQILAIVGCLLTRSRTGIALYGIYVLLKSMRFTMVKGRVKKSALILIFSLVSGCLFAIILFAKQIVEYLRVDTLMTGNGRLMNSNEMMSTLMSQNLFRVFFGNGLTVGRTTIFENSYLLCLYSFGMVGIFVMLFVLIGTLKGKLGKQNWIIISCFLMANAVGDYLLIPQVAIYFILCLFLNQYRKDNNKCVCYK